MEKKNKKGNYSNVKSHKVHICLVCSEPYSDPPTEEWIQCGDCKDWAHESAPPIKDTEPTTAIFAKSNESSVLPEYTGQKDYLHY